MMCDRLRIGLRRSFLPIAVPITRHATVRASIQFLDALRSPNASAFRVTFQVDHERYPANLCPLGCYVVNEVRRLADDSLLHDGPNARQVSEGCHCLLKH